MISSYLPILMVLTQLFGSIFFPNDPKQDTYEIEIPLGGNTFQTAGNEIEKIGNDGIESWGNEDSEFSVYVSANKKQSVTISLQMNAQSSEGIIQLSLNGKMEDISIESNSESISSKKKFDLKKGYNQIILKGLKKKSADFPLIENISLMSDRELDLSFVKDNISNRFYWGRRGPSVHLSYIYPELMDFKWFYSEVTVPKGSDPIGSYFMANGFAEGYFGIQVNSESERRILFSVWSPFKTDNPGDIPKEEQIQLLKKGDCVYTGEFGNEGSGGQSYLVYKWKAGETYSFLNSVEPDGKGNTVYTAYFKDPEVGEWILIASFLRPKTDTWYKRPHSFLENFVPENGYLTRMATYGNQTLINTKGIPVQLLKTRFTGDDIAKRSYRKDVTGGSEGDHFFLKNGGFFNDPTELNSMHQRKMTMENLEIDFDNLP